MIFSEAAGVSLQAKNDLWIIKILGKRMLDFSSAVDKCKIRSGRIKQMKKRKGKVRKKRRDNWRDERELCNRVGEQRNISILSAFGIFTQLRPRTVPACKFSNVAKLRPFATWLAAGYFHSSPPPPPPLQFSVTALMVAADFFQPAKLVVYF